MDFQFESRLYEQGAKAVAGVDEVGRGALAGPVVAAAVLFPADAKKIPEGIKDSKQLSASRREALFEKIQEAALSIGIASFDAKEIDEMNIRAASLQAMVRAIRKLDPHCDHALVDGRDRIPIMTVEQTPIVQGDCRCLSIAAASIIAKVTRDRWMHEYDKVYSLYGFAKHVGYGTQEHKQAIKTFGACELHRQSFRGVGPAR